MIVYSSVFYEIAGTQHRYSNNVHDTGFPATSRKSDAPMHILQHPSVSGKNTITTPVQTFQHPSVTKGKSMAMMASRKSNTPITHRPSVTKKNTPGVCITPTSNKDSMATTTSSPSVQTVQMNDSIFKSAVTQMTSMLTNIVERVERVEAELQHQWSTGGSSSCAESSPKHVPLVVRVRVLD